ncbi:hypothetical protein D3C74_436040 [compost metagenome]
MLLDLFPCTKPKYGMLSPKKNQPTVIVKHRLEQLLLLPMYGVDCVSTLVAVGIPIFAAKQLISSGDQGYTLGG